MTYITNKNNQAEGFHIGSQTPIDDRLIFSNLSELQDLGVDDRYAYKYYEGMRVWVLSEQKEYTWVESTSGELTTSFTYPSGIVVNGVSYSGRSFNFVETGFVSVGLFLPLAGGTMSGTINMDGNTIQLSDESGDIQSISTLAGDIIIGSDAYALKVETDGGLNVSNGITSQGDISSLGDINFNANGLVLRFNEVGPAYTGDLGKVTLTANRTWDLPDDSGTIALISDLTGDGIYTGSGTIPASTVATLTNSVQFGSAYINNFRTIIGATSTSSSGTLVVQGISNASTTNFTVYGGTLSGRIDFGVSANNPNVAMYDSAGVQQVNFDSGSSSSWTLRPFGVNMVGGTARLSVKALSNGTDQAFRIRNNTDTLDLMKVQGNGRIAIGDITTPTAKLDILGEGTTTGIGLKVSDSAGVENLSIFDNGRVVLGKDTSGSYDFGINIKSLDNVNLMTIEDSAGNDYYTFSAGSMYIRASANIAAIKMGGLLSTDTIEARGVYTGAHDWEIYNPIAATRIARFRTASNVGGTTAGGIVHLDMANNGGVKIGGNTTYVGTEKFTVRNASNQYLFNVLETGEVAINSNSSNARLSVKALSNGTDQVFAVRNNTDTSDLFKVLGNGHIYFGKGIGTYGITNINVSDSEPLDVGHGIFMSSTASNVYGTKISYSSGVGGVGGNAYGHYIELGGANANNTAVAATVYDYVGSSRTHTAIFGQALRNANGTGGTATLYGGDFKVGTLFDRSASIATAIRGQIVFGGTGTITTATGLDITTNIAAGDTCTTMVGIKVDVGTLGTVTNRYAATFMNGNVGIGTTSPSAKLTVSGDIDATSYKVGGVAGFTGTGAYTNFTITNGIITAAS